MADVHLSALQDRDHVRGGGVGAGDPRLIRRCVVINIFTNVGTLVSFTLFVKTITVSR